MDKKKPAHNRGARYEAYHNGDVHYNGKKCKNCGTTLKFTINWSCVLCTADRNKTRDPKIYKRWHQSELGRKTIATFRTTDTYKENQKEYQMRSGQLKKYYQENKDNWAKSNLKKYNLTVDQYNEMLYNQNNSCYICGTEANGKKLAVDHNHKTGDNRKLLCSKCNTSLGLLGEDTSIMKKMIQYVEEHE